MIFQGRVKESGAKTLFFAGGVKDTRSYKAWKQLFTTSTDSFILESVKDVENTLSSFKEV